MVTDAAGLDAVTQKLQRKSSLKRKLVVGAGVSGGVAALAAVIVWVAGDSAGPVQEAPVVSASTVRRAADTQALIAPSAPAKAEPTTAAAEAETSDTQPSATVVDAEELFDVKAVARASIGTCSASAEPKKIADSLWGNVLPRVQKLPGESSYLVGFASDSLDATGLKVDAESLDAAPLFEEHHGTYLTSVTPLVRGGSATFLTARYGALEGAVAVDAAEPFTIGQTPQGLGVVFSKGGGAFLWRLPKKAGVRALNVGSSDNGHAVVLRLLTRPGTIRYGRLNPDGSKLGALHTVHAGLVSGPSVALEGDQALIAFAEQEGRDGPERLRVTSAVGDDAPGTVHAFEPDADGPGGPQKLPALAALGTQFVMVWTEGAYRQEVIRGQTLDQVGAPVGKAFVVSTPGHVAHTAAITSHDSDLFVVYTEGAGTGRALWAATFSCR